MRPRDAGSRLGTPMPSGMDVRLSEVLAALSHALDITEGQPRGHAERTCLIAMRIAEHLELDRHTRTSLFHAALLKDAGCSSNAAKVAALYGADDADVKRDRKTTDHLRPAETLRHLARSTAPGRGPLQKARHLKALVDHGAEGSRALTGLRCERGAAVALTVGLDDVTAQAIGDLDEHWDGRGYPLSLEGEQISLCGRILCVAQTAEVFWQDGGGARGACEVVRKRRGTWFDPALVDAVDAIEHDHVFWSALGDADLAALEPADRQLMADAAGLDRIAEAFAGIVDAKSPYTGRHSAGVAEITALLGTALGLDQHRTRELRRAALLHDIGKLGISNRILDKPGQLDAQEWAAIRRHPELTWQILERVPAFSDLARVAAAHHERLDGSGYFLGLTAKDLDMPSRILAVADVAEALSAERPYRAALAPDVVLEIMRRDAGTVLDAHVFAALEHVLPRWAGTVTARPALALAA